MCMYEYVCKCEFRKRKQLPSSRIAACVARQKSSKARQKKRNQIEGFLLGFCIFLDFLHMNNKNTVRVLQLGISGAWFLTVGVCICLSVKGRLPLCLEWITQETLDT